MLRLPLGLCAALPFALLVGCSGKVNQAPGKVSGRVTYKGTAVPAGSIAFHVEGKQTIGSPLASDGTYEITDIPIGPAVVTVETQSVNPATKAPDYGGKGAKMYAERLAKEGRAAAAREAKAEYRKIPPNYANPKTSPLHVTLEAGRQVHNFELKD
jgi:hypothetical protein